MNVKHLINISTSTFISWKYIVLMSLLQSKEILKSSLQNKKNFTHLNLKKLQLCRD